MARRREPLEDGVPRTYVEVDAGQGVVLGHGHDDPVGWRPLAIQDGLRRDDLRVGRSPPHGVDEEVEGGIGLVGADAPSGAEDRVGVPTGRVDEGHALAASEVQPIGRAAQPGHSRPRRGQLDLAMRRVAHRLGREWCHRDAGLQAQAPTHGLVQPVLADATLAHRGLDAIDERDLSRQVAAIVVVVLLGQHDDVHACVDGLDDGVRRVVVGAHRVHVHAVRDDGALEAELAAQDLLEDERRKRRRTVRVQRRKDDVGGHHERRASRDAEPEGQQVHLEELFAGASHGGQAAVAVDRGVAVARKVLQGGDGARRQHAGHGGLGHLADEPRHVHRTSGCRWPRCAGSSCSRRRARTRRAGPPPGSPVR